MLFISVLNYHSAAATAHCLNGLEGACGGSQFRAIVGDHSTECEVERIKSSISSRALERIDFYYRPNNPGFARGHNQNFVISGIKPSDVFLVLNNDIDFPDPAIFNVMIKRCAPGTILGCVITRSSDRKIWFSGGRLNRFTGDARPVKATPNDEIVDTDFLCGCCMMMCAADFETLGGFDETFFMYAEDLDFSLRAVQQGFRLRVVNRELTHSVGGYSDGQYSDLFLHENTKNRLICLVRHQLGVPGIRVIYFLLMYCLGRTVQLCLFSKARLRQIKAVISGAMDGWRCRRPG